MSEKDLINIPLINEKISNYLDDDFDEEKIIKGLEEKLTEMSNDYVHVCESRNKYYKYHITYENVDTQYSFELTEMYWFDIDGSYELVDIPSGLDDEEHIEIVDLIEDFLNRLKVKYARFMINRI